MTIPITAVDLPDRAEALVLEVLRSGRLAQGPMVERLEQGMAAMAGVAHAVATSSGTTALVAAIEALQLEQGDEVLTSPFTFIATVNAILEAGAVAAFADVGPDLTMDVGAVEAAIGPRTRAIMPVHLYGLPADMVGLAEIAGRHDLAIVEDAAQAHGAAIGGRPVGSWGLGCFSLYATKNVAAGEGGVVTTDDVERDDRLRLLRNHGMRERYRYEIQGHNYRMTELQAAVGLAELEALPRRNEARRRNADLLSAGLAGLEGLLLPVAPGDRAHVWHQYTIRVTEAASMDRDELARALASEGIETGIYYPRVAFDHACYREHDRVRSAHVPVAETAARQVLSLPVHPALRPPDLERIVESVRHALRA